MLDRRNVLAALSLACLCGCAVLPTSGHVDPTADFAAHRAPSGIVVDAMAGARAGVLVHPAAGDRDLHLLQAEGQTIAALWIGDDGQITVRSTADPTAPVVGEVGTSWDNGILRLTFRTADDTSYHTSRFRRLDSRNAPQALGDMRSPFALRGLPGIYRAELRDEGNLHVGWLRVRILPYSGLPRDFDAEVPPELDGPLTAGAVSLLDSEIDAMVAENAFPQDRAPGGLVP